MSRVSSIVELLRSRHPGAVSLLAGSPDAECEEIRFIEQPEQIDDATPGTLLVLDRGMSAVVADYRFDIVVRRAAARRVAALMVAPPAGTKVSFTALALARRAGPAIVELGPEVDLTEAVGTIVRQAADRLSLTVGRARAVCDAVDGHEFTDGSELLERVGLLLGRPVVLGPPLTGTEVGLVLAVPAGPGGDEWLRTDRPGDPDADALLEMVLWRVAAETTRLTAARVRAEQTSRRSAGEVLVQLIEADRTARTAIAPSARRLGIPIDGWHVVVRLEPDNLLEVAGGDAAAFERRDELAGLALQAAGSLAGRWHVGHDPAALLLVWTGQDPPRGDDVARLDRQLDFVVTTLVGRLPGLRVFCGVGTARAGLAGLVSSATEARLAVSSARFRRRVGTPVHFDAVGMRATLIEWYGSPTVQQAIDRLFAPLADLGPGKRQMLIDTLSIYLDLQGSTAKAAEVLHLHRNAVRYRVQRAFELLGIDESDADQRLFLHLACRAQRVADAGG